MNQKQLRTLILFILIFFIIFPAFKAEAADDKALHFGVSALCGAAAESYLHYMTELNTGDRIALGTLIGTVPGLLKEVADSLAKDNFFSGEDLAFDVAGSLVGSICGNLLNNIIQVKISRENKSVSVSLIFTCSF